jgi:probable HAF family extracellular repeat protein
MQMNRWAFAAGIVTLPAFAIAQARFVPLGSLPSDKGNPESRAYAVSADGLIVVGASRTLGAGGEYVDQPFRWTPGDGMLNLGTLPGVVGPGRATGVSGDGSVVVGYFAVTTDDLSEFRAFMWTDESGMRELPYLQGHHEGAARGISADGRVIVGNSGDARPVRWIDGVPQSLGTAPGISPFGYASAVSENGSVVAGCIGCQFASIWQEASGMASLGDLPGGHPFSFAYAVSPEGSVVVGYSNIDFNQNIWVGNAFKWTQADGMIDLGVSGRAFGVSWHGDVIVGWRYGDVGAFITRPGYGTMNLRGLLASRYFLAQELEGWSLVSAQAVTPEGRTIVGYGVNPSGKTEAFAVHMGYCRFDWDQNGSLGSNDFFTFLTAFFGGEADFDGSGQTTSEDFFHFVNGWLARSC